MTQAPNQPDPQLLDALEKVSQLLTRDPTRAGQQARRILDRFPGEVNAGTLLAASLRLRGKAGKAVDLLQQITSRAPGFALAHQELGLSLASLNRPGAAISELNKALALQPQLPMAAHALADVYARQGDYQQARLELERCLELAPDFHAARFDYVRALFLCLDYAEALDQIDQLLLINPNDLSWQLQSARILVRIGHFEPAGVIYRQVLERHPEMAKAHLSHGHVLKALGRREACVNEYRESCRLQPGLGEAWWSLSELKTYRFSDEEMHTMRTQIDQLDTRSAEFVHLCFALGKALELSQRYDEAFSFYARGNAAKRLTTSWNADEHQASVQRSIEFFDESFFAQHAAVGCTSAEPVFIVGLPRSGSTLLEQILASHSRVEGTMELPNIVSLAARLDRAGQGSGQSGYPEVLAGIRPDQFREMGEQYLEQTRILRHDTPLFIDKMPNNFLHIGLIHLMLPNARIIDARRHPMACCFSGFIQLFSRGQGFSFSLDDIGRYYRDYEKLLQHWDRVLPGRVLRVQYENVVSDTDRELRRMLDYCGLEFEPQCLQFHASDRHVRTASSEQVRQPIYTAAVEHWRHFESHLEPLAAVLR